MSDTPNVGSSNDGLSAEQQQLGKLALETGPLGIFFLTYWLAGIFWATGSLMIATAISLAVSWRLYGRVPVMPLVSGFCVLVFGGLTLLLQDEVFIKMKPTIVNMLFASVLFGGLVFGQSLLKYLFGEVFQLSEEGWRQLTVRWGLFFVCLAVLNELVWRNFSEEFWVSFKVFGILPLSMVFALSQVGLIKRYQQA